MALVDPNIALSFKQPNFQPTNALAQYAQIAQIQGNQQQQQLNALKMQEAQATMQERNALRSLDPRSANYENQLFRLNPQLGISYRKERTAADASEATQKKQQTDTEAKLLEQARNFLPGVKDQASYDNWRAVTLKNLPGYESYLPPAYSAEGVQQLMMTADKALENHYFQQNTGGEVVQYGVNKYGTPGTPTAVQTSPMTPLPQDVEAQKTRIGKASASNISLSTEKKYGEAVAAGGGKTDLDIYDAAQAAPKNIRKIDEVLSVLRKEDINTGIGADLFNVLDKARGMVLADEKANKRAVSTEYLNSLLGSDVFPQISALNIGARGLDTPAEREFLREVLTGRIGLNKDTLIRMTELRRKGIETSVADYNQLVDSGELDSFFAARQRKKSRIDLPQPSTAPTRSVVRTGTANNRKVIEYSDGSIEYAH